MDKPHTEVLKQALKGASDRLFITYGRKGANDGSAVGVIVKVPGAKGSNFAEVMCDCGWPTQAMRVVEAKTWVCRNCSRTIGEAKKVEAPE